MVVRVGIVGCGFIARYHAMQLGLAEEPNEIVAVCEPDPDRAMQFAGDVGAPVLSSVGEVAEAADAVFVCTWTAEHLEVVTAVAAAGRAVFCEKPLGTDLDDARLVAREMQRCPTNMSGLVLRSSPALLAVREMLAEVGAGRLMNVVFRDDQFLPVRGMYGSDWRADAARAGSGVLLEHSIHDVDLLEWLAGPIESAAAQEANFHRIDGIEDSVSVLGRFVGGASFTLSSVWHEIDDRPSQRRIELFCEHRLITLEGDIFGPVSVQSDDESFTIEGDELVRWLRRRGVPLGSAEQQFLRAVRMHEHPRPDADDALRAHEVVDALYASARGGGERVRLRG